MVAHAEIAATVGDRAAEITNREGRRRSTPRQPARYLHRHDAIDCVWYVAIGKLPYTRYGKSSGSVTQQFFMMNRMYKNINERLDISDMALRDRVLSDFTGVASASA
jgi:hypothetical protein